MIDIQTIVLAALGAAFIGYTWYLKVRPQGEALNWYKLGQSALFGGVSGVVLAYLGITITDTAVIDMIKQLGFSMDDLANISVLVVGVATALLGGTGGLIVENLWKALQLPVISKTKVVATASSVTAATTEVAQHLGFTVLPTFLEGKSPFLAVIQLKCSTICIGWRIDWLDGSPLQDGGFVAEGEYNVANVYHTYHYQFDGKYTGHTFYPKITIISKDGIVNTFNTEVTGRCLSIGVNA